MASPLTPEQMSAELNRQISGPPTVTVTDKTPDSGFTHSAKVLGSGIARCMQDAAELPGSQPHFHTAPSGSYEAAMNGRQRGGDYVGLSLSLPFSTGGTQGARFGKPNVDVQVSTEGQHAGPECLIEGAGLAVVDKTLGQRFSAMHDGIAKFLNHKP